MPQELSDGIINIMESETIQRQEVAKILGISIQGVDRYRKAGYFKSVQYTPRGFHHYYRSEILAFRDGKKQSSQSA